MAWGVCALVLLVAEGAEAQQCSDNFEIQRSGGHACEWTLFLCSSPERKFDGHEDLHQSSHHWEDVEGAKIPQCY